ncbi:MAG: glycosyltransferase family 4 protein [Bacillota bacterium]
MDSWKVPVLLLPMSLGIGGAETQVVSLAKHLRGRGWDVLVASAGGQLVAALEQEGIEHYDAPLDSRSPLDMLRAGRIVDELVSHKGVGLVHAHARIPAWIAEKVCRRRGIPMVMTYHGTFASGLFWNAFTRPGDATIAKSDDIRDYIARKFGFDASKITVIPNGIDRETFHPAAPHEQRAARAALGQDAASPVVLYASRLDGGLANSACATIEACAGLVPRYPALTLLVAGDGDGLEKVQDCASSANRKAGREFVRCTGFVYDTFQAYAASDVVVGMSRVALEAMACSRPVVIAGPDGIVGLVAPDNEEALEQRNYTSRNAPYELTAERLASNIDELLRDPGLREKLGRYGAEVVERRHSMEEVALRTEEVYGRLLRSRRKS